MISPDVKANLKQKIKELVAVSIRSTLKNLKYNVKRACIFYLIGIPSTLTLSVNNRKWGGEGG